MFVRKLSAFLALILAVYAAPAYAQQTGSIVGKVVDSGGGVLPGVTVEASSSVLPTPRTTVSGANGEYRLPACRQVTTPSSLSSPACSRRRGRPRFSSTPTRWWKRPSGLAA